MWLCRKVVTANNKTFTFWCWNFPKKFVKLSAKFLLPNRSEEVFKGNYQRNLSVGVHTESENGKGWQIHMFNTKKDYLNMAGSFFVVASNLGSDLIFVTWWYLCLLIFVVFVSFSDVQTLWVDAGQTWWRGVETQCVRQGGGGLGGGGGGCGRRSGAPQPGHSAMLRDCCCTLGHFNTLQQT